MKTLSQHINESFQEINEKGNSVAQDFGNHFSDDNELLIAIEKLAKKSAKFAKSIIAKLKSANIKGSEALTEECDDISIDEEDDVMESQVFTAGTDFANHFSNDNLLLVAIENAAKKSAEFASKLISKLKDI